MSKLKIAIQKKGRLNQQSLELLKEAGISISASKNKLLAATKDFPLEVLFLRDDDIPKYVERGIADLGIVGQNELFETKTRIETIRKLGFAECKMNIAIPRQEEYLGMEWLKGKRIATSYPQILKEFLQKNQINAKVEIITGSVEIAPSIGLAEAVFDIVSTGSTLLMNGLKSVETVLQSEAVLIGQKKIESPILEELLNRLDAVQTAKKSKYIMLNAPTNQIENITQLLPGMKYPTIQPLAINGWSSVQSVVNEDRFWPIMNKLKTLGAEGILVLPIEKMIL